MGHNSPHYFRVSKPEGFSVVVTTWSPYLCHCILWTELISIYDKLRCSNGVFTTHKMWVEICRKLNVAIFFQNVKMWELGCLLMVTKKWKSHYALTFESIIGYSFYWLNCILISEGDEEGRASQYFFVNVAPHYGHCFLMPNRGNELDQIFQVNCHEWVDDDVSICFFFNQVPPPNLKLLQSSLASVLVKVKKYKEWGYFCLVGHIWWQFRALVFPLHGVLILSP